MMSNPVTTKVTYKIDYGTDDVESTIHQLKTMRNKLREGLYLYPKYHEDFITQDVVGNVEISTLNAPTQHKVLHLNVKQNTVTLLTDALDELEGFPEKTTQVTLVTISQPDTGEEPIAVLTFNKPSTGQTS